MNSPAHNHHVERNPGTGFTPAFPVLRAYDFLIRALTREQVWRSALITELAPQAFELIVDVGCGTGTLLEQIGHASPKTRLIGIDPDDHVLRLAARKLARSGVTATLLPGYLHELNHLLADLQVGTITSSLVFHQVPLAEKRAGLAAMYSVLPPGSRVLIADYGLQRTLLMRVCFKLIQRIDGYEDTQPNAEGIIPELMAGAGFLEVEELHVIPTATGSISIYRGVKPVQPAARSNVRP